MYTVLKRDGRIINFDIQKIAGAIKLAFDAQERNYNQDIIDFLALKVTADFEPKIKDNTVTVEKSGTISGSVLKLGMIHPMPVERIKNFANKVGKLYIVEELDPIIENHVKSLGIEVIGKEKFSILGEFSQKTIADAFGVKYLLGYSVENEVGIRNFVF